MIQASQITKHMEVVGSDGGHVGTVDHMQDGQIKLTKKDPAAAGQHHMLPLSAAVSIEGGKLKLGIPAADAMKIETPAG